MFLPGELRSLSDGLIAGGGGREGGGVAKGTRVVGGPRAELVGDMFGHRVRL